MLLASSRVRREMNTATLTELVRRLRPLGLATGDAGFNVDFHAIRHHGEDAPLEDNYVPKLRHEVARNEWLWRSEDQLMVT